jgi:membrane-bound lytic murein transglycosylase D
VSLSAATAQAIEAEAGVPPAAIEDPDFPQPAAMSSAVAFWKRVYLEATTEAGLLHDSRELGVVYEIVRFGERKGRRTRQRHVDSRKKHWRSVLRRLAKGGAPRDSTESGVLHLLELELGHEPTARDLHNAARRIRFQLGQRDKFRAGIIRSGAYEDEMRATFRHEGLPEDLAYLPHVESSFNVDAYSKYGAAGLWQFMRSTGRRYLTINYVVDQRLDPPTATRAAARLLRENYQSLDSWPLAITAYNHGAAGMRRAKRKLGTDDMATIIRKYKSRTFGFASRNFYAQFLAARSILHSYEPYFGPLRRDQPVVVDEVKLPFYADVHDLRDLLGVSPDVIRHYNRALRRPVFTAGKRIPKGYVLRLPAGIVHPDQTQWLAAIPPGKRHAEQYHSNYYQVRRGDTLSGIARRHRTSVGTLVSLNNLPSRHRIYRGQVLQLPDKPGTKKRRKPKVEIVRSAQAAPPPLPKPAPPPTLRPAGPAMSPPAPPDDSPWRRVDGDRVVIDADETLGHFAEWLEVSAQRLRDLNDLPYSRALRIGQTLRLDFSRVNAGVFLERRTEYHKGIEEDFLGSFRVTGTLEHKLARGESIWQLSHRTYKVPTWLIRRYNPDTDLTQLSPGVKLVIPVVESL